MADQNTNPDNVTRVDSSQHMTPIATEGQADQTTIGDMSTTQNLESAAANSSTAAAPNAWTSEPHF